MHVGFGPFTLDDATRELRRGADRLHVSPKAFELLSLLLRESPNAVSKADIHAAVWPESFVSDGTVAVLVAELRRAMGDSARDSTYIRTVSRFGYAFLGPVAREAGPAARRGRVACWLIHGPDRFRLHPGENILGRDLDADVVIDAVGVSRRHAAIQVDDAGVVLRDLESKNGTFLDGSRVTAPVVLRDLAEVRLGAFRLQFRRPIDRSTQALDEPTGVPGAS